MTYKIEIIQEFEFFKPVSVLPEGAIALNPKYHDESREDYYIISDSTESYESEVFYHVPVFLRTIRNSNGDDTEELWEHANAWIQKKLQTISKKTGRNLDRETIDDCAKSLIIFINHCEKHNINYLVSQNSTKSPIARFKRYQLDKQDAGLLAASTIKSRLNKIVQFYKFLKSDFKVEFKYCPWLSTKKGSKPVNTPSGIIMVDWESTEVGQVQGAARETSEMANMAGELFDEGERLRPLTPTETRILFRALYEIDNPEMTLAHELIIATGARKQTIFTLRQHHFERKLSDGETIVYIEAGKFKDNVKGYAFSLADSKGTRHFIVAIPDFLYTKIQMYIKSERAQKRYAKATYKPYRPSVQYVFMTEQKRPFICSKRDPWRNKYKNTPNGGALNTFIKDKLKPKLAALGFVNPEKNYHFHNGRATFGVLKLDFYLANMSKAPGSSIGKEYERALALTQKALNHATRETTMHYVDFEKNYKIIQAANSGWGDHLKIIAGLK